MSDTNPKQKTWTDEEFSALIGRAICHPDIWQEAKRARHSEAALKARCEELEKLLARGNAIAEDLVEGYDEGDIPESLRHRADALTEDVRALLSPRDGEAK